MHAGGRIAHNEEDDFFKPVREAWAAITHPINRGFHSVGVWGSYRNPGESISSVLRAIKHRHLNPFLHYHVYPLGWAIYYSGKAIWHDLRHGTASDMTRVADVSNKPKAFVPSEVEMSVWGSQEAMQAEYRLEKELREQIIEAREDFQQVINNRTWLNDQFNQLLQAIKANPANYNINDVEGLNAIINVPAGNLQVADIKEGVDIVPAYQEVWREKIEQLKEILINAYEGSDEQKDENIKQKEKELAALFTQFLACQDKFNLLHEQILYYQARLQELHEGNLDVQTDLNQPLRDQPLYQTKGLNVPIYSLITGTVFFTGVFVVATVAVAKIIAVSATSLILATPFGWPLLAMIAIAGIISYVGIDNLIAALWYGTGGKRINIKDTIYGEVGDNQAARLERGKYGNVAIWAIIGAVIGTIILPGIGTAIGAAGLAGLAYIINEYGIKNVGATLYALVEGMIDGLFEGAKVGWAYFFPTVQVATDVWKSDEQSKWYKAGFFTIGAIASVVSFIARALVIDLIIGSLQSFVGLLAGFSLGATYVYNSASYDEKLKDGKTWAKTPFEWWLRVWGWNKEKGSWTAFGPLAIIGGLFFGVSYIIGVVCRALIFDVFVGAIQAIMLAGWIGWENFFPIEGERNKQSKNIYQQYWETLTNSSVPAGLVMALVSIPAALCGLAFRAIKDNIVAAVGSVVAIFAGFIDGIYWLAGGSPIQEPTFVSLWLTTIQQHIFLYQDDKGKLKSVGILGIPLAAINIIVYVATFLVATAFHFLIWQPIKAAVEALFYGISYGIAAGGTFFAYLFPAENPYKMVPEHAPGVMAAAPQHGGAEEQAVGSAPADPNAVVAESDKLEVNFWTRINKISTNPKEIFNAWLESIKVHWQQQDYVAAIVTAVGGAAIGATFAVIGFAFRLFVIDPICGFFGGLIAGGILGYLNASFFWPFFQGIKGIAGIFGVDLNLDNDLDQSLARLTVVGHIIGKDRPILSRIMHVIAGILPFLISNIIGFVVRSLKDMFVGLVEGIVYGFVAGSVGMFHKMTYTSTAKDLDFMRNQGSLFNRLSNNRWTSGTKTWQTLKDAWNTYYEQGSIFALVTSVLFIPAIIVGGSVGFVAGIVYWGCKAISYAWQNFAKFCAASWDCLSEGFVAGGEIGFQYFMLSLGLNKLFGLFGKEYKLSKHETNIHDHLVSRLVVTGQNADGLDIMQDKPGILAKLVGQHGKGSYLGFVIGAIVPAIFGIIVRLAYEAIKATIWDTISVTIWAWLAQGIFYNDYLAGTVDTSLNKKNAIKNYHGLIKDYKDNNDYLSKIIHGALWIGLGLPLKVVGFIFSLAWEAVKSTVEIIGYGAAIAVFTAWNYSAGLIDALFDFEIDFNEDEAKASSLTSRFWDRFDIITADKTGSVWNAWWMSVKVHWLEKNILAAGLVLVVGGLFNLGMIFVGLGIRFIVDMFVGLWGGLVTGSSLGYLNSLLWPLGALIRYFGGTADSNNEQQLDRVFYWNLILNKDAPIVSRITAWIAGIITFIPFYIIGFAIRSAVDIVIGFIEGFVYLAAIAMVGAWNWLQKNDDEIDAAPPLVEESGEPAVIGSEGVVDANSAGAAAVDPVGQAKAAPKQRWWQRLTNNEYGSVSKIWESIKAALKDYWQKGSWFSFIPAVIGGIAGFAIAGTVTVAVWLLKEIVMGTVAGIYFGVLSGWHYSNLIINAINFFKKNDAKIATRDNQKELETEFGNYRKNFMSRFLSYFTMTVVGIVPFVFGLACAIVSDVIWTGLLVSIWNGITFGFRNAWTRTEWWDNYKTQVEEMTKQGSFIAIPFSFFFNLIGYVIGSIVNSIVAFWHACTWENIKQAFGIALYITLGAIWALIVKPLIMPVFSFLNNILQGISGNFDSVDFWVNALKIAVVVGLIVGAVFTGGSLIGFLALAAAVNFIINQICHKPVELSKFSEGGLVNVLNKAEVTPAEKQELQAIHHDVVELFKQVREGQATIEANGTVRDAKEGETLGGKGYHITRQLGRANNADLLLQNVLDCLVNGRVKFSDVAAHGNFNRNIAQHSIGRSMFSFMGNPGINKLELNGQTITFDVHSKSITISGQRIVPAVREAHSQSTTGKDSSAPPIIPTA